MLQVKLSSVFTNFWYFLYECMLSEFTVSKKKNPCSSVTTGRGKMTASVSVFTLYPKRFNISLLENDVLPSKSPILLFSICSRVPGFFFGSLFLTFKCTIVSRSPQWNNALVQRSTKSNDKLSVTSIMLAMHRNIYIWWSLWYMNVQDEKWKIHFKFCLYEKLTMICNLRIA